MVSPVSKQARKCAGGWGWERRRRGQRLGNRHSEVHAGETPLCSPHSLLALVFWKKTRERAGRRKCGAHIQAGSLRPLPASLLQGEPHSATASLSRPPALLHPLDILGLPSPHVFHQHPQEHPMYLLLVSSLVNYHPPGGGPGTKATLDASPISCPLLPQGFLTNTLLPLASCCRLSPPLPSMTP